MSQPINQPKAKRKKSLSITTELFDKVTEMCKLPLSMLLILIDSRYIPLRVGTVSQFLSRVFQGQKFPYPTELGLLWYKHGIYIIMVINIINCYKKSKN